jgi:hypothetical protein
MNSKTPYGPLLLTVAVQGINVQIVNPAAMIYSAVAEGGSYACMVQAALQERPPSFERPWRMAVYSDEVTPGNVTAPDNRRKVWGLHLGIV